MGRVVTGAGWPAAIVSLLALGPSCSDGPPATPTGPSAAAVLSERLETAHFTFAFATGDRVDPEFQEAFHDWATRVLEVSPDRHLRYNKYRNRAHMQQVIGIGNTNAWADGPSQTAHTIWAQDNHEVVHLYTFAWGMPVALFSEGIAVAHQTAPIVADLVPKWSGTPIHALVRQFRAQGRLLPLAQLTTSADFRQHDPEVTYPEAGSFVRHAIDTRGLDRLRALFGRLSATSPATTVREQVLAVYGVSLDELEREWLAFLDGR